MRPFRWIAVIGATALLVACAGPTAPSTPTPAASDGPGGAALCEPIDLRGRDGRRVDLNGTWEREGEVWLVTHSGSCVTIEGLSAYGGEPAGSSYRFVVTGDLRSDLTVEGSWTWTWTCRGFECPNQAETRPVVLDIGFDADGEATIEMSSFADEGTVASTITRISPTTEWPEP